MASEYLISILDDYDHEDAKSKKKELREIQQERKREHEELMKSVEGLCSGTPLSILGFSPEIVEGLHPYGMDRKILEWKLDDCFCWALLKRIPTMVSRALRMDPW